MNTLEQQIAERVRQLPADDQRHVLAFVEQLTVPRPSARTLLQMPRDQREAILHAQLAQSAQEDFETFEAYIEEDLDASL